MEYKLNFRSLREDVNRHLSLENKRLIGENSIGCILYDTIHYDKSKLLIKNKSFIDDINSGFCCLSEMPGYNKETKIGIWLLENFRIVSGYIGSLYIELDIGCLVEGDIFINATYEDLVHSPSIIFDTKFILEGSEYKIYTFVSIRVKLPNYNHLGIKEFALKDWDWLDYISSVFQECVELNIEQLKQ